MKTKVVELIFPVIFSVDSRSQQLSKRVPWAKYFLWWIEKSAWTGRQSIDFSWDRVQSAQNFMAKIMAAMKNDKKTKKNMI